MTQNEHLQAGKLDEAVAAAIENVKGNPTDVGKRIILSELLCLTGNLDRADLQLDTITKQDPTAIAAILARQLLRSEKSRQEFYSDGRLPDFLEDPPEHLRLHLEASIHLREGRIAEAVELLTRAEELRPQVRGTCNGEAFEDIRDLDDLTAPFIEVLTSNGKYYWIAFERIELMEFRKPESLRDLIWRSVHMVVRGGPDGEVFVPALYAGTSAQSDNALRLGRATEWSEEEGEPVRGLGQRTLLVGEKDIPILQLNEVKIEAVAAEEPAES